MRHPVIHIVKRFGRVGGMESYVWHLVHGLFQSGIDVIIVCEQICESPLEGMRIIQVEASPERPRWKSMLTFRNRVDQMIRQEFRGQSVVIHSHERSLSHQVTTLHGPPIGQPTGIRWLSRFNRRVSAWRDMERDELLGPHVQILLPVSSIVLKDFEAGYPAIGERIIEMAWPGVDTAGLNRQSRGQADFELLQFLFVGREWKRKGLDLAIDVVKEFRRTHQEAVLTVIGVTSDQLPTTINSLDWVRVMGWQTDIPWLDFDLLIHPARKEPFGMVVSEARNHGLPVLLSNNVGAQDLEFSETKTLDIDSAVSAWSDAAAQLIQQSTRKPENKWSWSDLVAKHVQTIYPEVRAWTI